MDLKKLFTHRVNVIFGFGCLMPILSIAASYMSSYAGLLYTLITGNEPGSGTEFWLTFILPQFFYPITSALLFLIPLNILHLKPSDAIEDKKSSPSQYLIYIPMLMLFSYVLTFSLNTIFIYLEAIGIKLPTVEALIPQPNNALEILGLLFVMTVLPALCEEFIYRVVFLGVLSPISKNAAILLSAIAFGLMHATIQQIPFAFGLGIILGYAYITTQNYRIPVLMHFINNFISCIFLILSYRLPEETAANISSLTVQVILLAGIIATVVFLIKRKKHPIEKVDETTTGQAMKAAIKAPLFWVFVGVYLLLTVITTLTYMYMAA